MSAVASQSARTKASGECSRMRFSPDSGSAYASGGNAAARPRSSSSSAVSSGPARQEPMPPGEIDGRSLPRATRFTPALAAADQAATPGLTSSPAVSSRGRARASGTSTASTFVRRNFAPCGSTSSIAVSPTVPSPHSAITPSRGGSAGR